jgi:hypothetical protein
MRSLTLPLCSSLALLILAGNPSSLWAKDNLDPAKRAEEAEMRGKAFLEEAEAVAKRAKEETGSLARDLAKFAELTAEEGKHLLEASEAWSKKQIRRAERAEREAAELCGERGKMLDKVYPKKDKPPIKEKAPPFEKPLAPLEKPNKPPLPPLPPNGPAKLAPPIQPEKPPTQSALEKIEAQSQQLGEE